MQNADNEASTSKASKAEQEQLQQEQQQEQQEKEDQQEEEEQFPAKIKARSRFSAAFRSLSKTSKKPSKNLAKQKPRSAEQLAENLSSNESVPKGDPKKQSLTRRLLLGSLRPKTKVRPHSDELSLRRSSSSGSRERGLGLEGSGANTLQITISGKKVETLAKGKGKKSTSAVSETDYLNPTPAETAAAIGAATGATAAASVERTTTTLTTKDTTSRTTKLIVAKVSKEATAQQQQKKKQQLREATTEEKIVITESRRDTPPRERAPAKPSRASGSNHQYASSSGPERITSTSLSSRKERALMQQQQRGQRLTRNGTTAAIATAKQALETPTSPEPESLPVLPTTAPPPLPAGSPPAVSLSDVEEQADAVSLAESAQTTSNQDTVAPPVVRFAVGSAVRSPVDAYEAALAAAAVAATQQPSSSEEPSDSSLRRLSFKQQQPQFALSDHDSIEGRRETLRYQSVASEYSNEDTQSEQEQEQEEELEQSKPMPAFGDLTMDQEMEPTIMSAASGEKREHLYKILVIGELGTGKTSFIKRYVHQFFSQNYRATIGVDFALKVLHWDANTIVRLQLWDIAGQERFGNMTRVYYKEAVGAFIVFDVTRSGTFDCVSKWKEDLDSKVQLPDGSPIPCILLANKCDQEKQGIVTQPERMDEYVRENGFAGWFETSAKENINIDEAARALVNKILINDKLITADANDDEKFNLSAADASADAKNKCSC
ncbi:protein bunched, class 2/F/G isoform [Drosophila montana]|uniref:protein bunched, class 2/F/G isoform n=1 Tax=Drosophila montana TaxID=40370 RepID=UPI00313B72E8